MFWVLVLISALVYIRWTSVGYLSSVALWISERVLRSAFCWCRLDSQESHINYLYDIFECVATSRFVMTRNFIRYLIRFFFHFLNLEDLFWVWLFTVLVSVNVKSPATQSLVSSAGDDLKKTLMSINTNVNIQIGMVTQIIRNYYYYQLYSTTYT